MRFCCYWRRQFVNIKNDPLHKLKPNHLMKYNSEKKKETTFGSNTFCIRMKNIISTF